MIYAFYRILYGEDFIIESIKSIENYVDKIFIFWSDEPWGNVEKVHYKGEIVQIPQKIDNVIAVIKQLNSPKVELIYNDLKTPRNQFTILVNGIILPNYKKPDVIIFMEPDHVFVDENIKKCLDQFLHKKELCMAASSVELWKYPWYKAVRTTKRLSTTFWNLVDINSIPECGLHGSPVNKNVNFLDNEIHNFGFCMSEKTMYYKHLLTIGFSKYIQDSIPDVDWYEDKWLNWDYETNNKNLEISLKYKHTISHAEPYDIDLLPELIKIKYEKDIKNIYDIN